MTTRRDFLAGAAVFAATPLLGSAGVSLSALASDPLRPQFHLLPPRGWMNDPNGPIVWNGKVHLFYQVNPTGGADWGDISWGHAVSTDMVHWKHLPVAMTPQPGGIDSYGVFSGSCIADGNRCLAFYTAVAPAPTPDEVTLVGSPEHEQQNVAVSTDPDLMHWTRQTQAVLPRPPLKNIAGFRDPCVWKQAGFWWMAVGSGQVEGEGCVLLYKATVPDGPEADWRYVHKLISAPGNGKHTPDTVDAGTMWECPDLFELDGHHVLLYSTERKVYWMTGELTAEMKFLPKQRGMLDSGAYYAPKSMTGPKGERILWGWIPEKRDKAEYIAAGWAGCMALPRVLHVDPQGMLRMSVAPEADNLLTGPKTTLAAGHSSVKLSGLSVRLIANLPAEESVLSAFQGDADLLHIRRVTAEHVEINGEVIKASVAGQMTIWLDGSVIEIFFGDRSAHTVRSYPRLLASSGLTVVLSGSGASVTVQTVQPISRTT